ncbi:MAG: hypothetical protein ACPL7C_04890 [Anaerolineae bacterium]|jgi:hypothetical protein
MFFSLSPPEDFRHTLQPGEHEAFYFAFTSSDGAVFGLLRTLFGYDSVLEILVLSIQGTTWFHHSPGEVGPRDADLDASGPWLRLRCSRPWEAWTCSFWGPVRNSAGQEAPLLLQLEFHATTPPDRYTFGPYTQAQQDGRLRGRIGIGQTDLEGEWLCYRDHSWGVRPMGVAMGWTVAWVPERLYAVRVETPQGPAGFGRFVAPDGSWHPLRVPRVALLETPSASQPQGFPWWRVEEPEGGLGPWTFTRIAEPLVGYLGPAGQEAFRPAPQPGDLLQDELGPARLISPQGELFTGFLEQARRLS